MVLAAAILAAALIFPAPARAAGADLDLTFGVGGSTVTRMGTISAGLDDVALQPDGKLVAAGSGNGANDIDIALARYTADGRLDPSFGSGGRVYTDLGANDGASTVLVQPDGRIVVVGNSSRGIDLITRFILARYNPDGTLDSTFGTNGTVVTDERWQARAGAHSADLAPDGSIVIAGGDAVMRFRADGSFDEGFARTAHNGTGLAYVPYDGFVMDVSVQPDGRILAGGYEPNVGMHVHRLTTGGLIDETFGEAGLATVSFGPGTEGNAQRMTVQADGSIVLVGSVSAYGGLLGSPQFAVARFTSSGRLDATFAGDGRFASPVPGAQDASAYDVASGTDGTLTVVGLADAPAPQPPGATHSSFIARLTPVGTLDPAFGNGGIRSVSKIQGRSTVDAFRLLVDPDGHILVGGNFSSPPNDIPEWFLLRLQGSAPGRLAQTWGWNPLGQLGDGTSADRHLPGPVSGGRAPAALSGGAYHSVSLGVDGSVWSWGWNGAGQLGDGTTTDRRTPVIVAGPGSATAVSAGGLHTLVLDPDGRVWAWGWNGAGQLGDGTRTDRRSPTPVALRAGPAVALAAGAYHSLAALDDGHVAAWGWNALGQLGDGTVTDRVTPVVLPGLADVTAVAGGSYHSLALRADGTVWAWGWNGAGQLGDGTTADRHAPVPVTGLDHVVAISAGMLHSLALRADGTVWAWGYNGQGELGDGTTSPRLRPVPVSGLSGATAIAAGGLHNVAAAADGRVFTWGWNGVGQVGDGTTADRLVATPSPALAGVKVVGAGAGHSLG